MTYSVVSFKGQGHSIYKICFFI